MIIKVELNNIVKFLLGLVIVLPSIAIVYLGCIWEWWGGMPALWWILVIIMGAFIIAVLGFLTWAAGDWLMGKIK